MKYMH